MFASDTTDVLAFQRVAGNAYDRFDYAPTGRTVAEMWAAGDDAVKRGMARAVKASWGMVLAEHDGQWGVVVGTAGHDGPAVANGIVDLGNGLCFRR
jgi:hypothetical protein